MNRSNLKPLAALTRWEGNYNQGDVEAIARSILRFGFNCALRVWRILARRPAGGTHSNRARMG